MSNVTPSTSGDLKKKVKKKTRPTNNGTKAGFVNPLYGEVLEMLEGDGSCSFTIKEFAQKYKLCHLGLNPKQVKVPRE
jgi:hypothetical protein